ncbi:MAG: tocopherol cyclase family protein [Candidatus Alcyoniella australis]|nr:tocopherol cyclase family protein [Candidatus Alcyoniella australis]
MIAGEKERANLLRWDGESRGAYEVYYLKFNHPQSRTAYWLRYTLTSPLTAVGEPYCELWGIFFNAADPSNNFALKDRFAIDRLRWERDRLDLRMADAQLTGNSCSGELVRAEQGLSLRWNLRFDSALPAFRHFPTELMYRAKLPKTKVIAPHEHALFRGWIEVCGRRIELDGVPGQQTHIWGSQHGLRWAWGHCNMFDQDPDAIWEGLHAQVKLGTLTSPPMKLFYVRCNGRDYKFNSLRQLVSNDSRWELGKWSFEARGPEAVARGEITSRFEDLICVTYMDPDGSNLWCNNSKVARIDLELKTPHGERIAELSSDWGAAVEFVDRRIYPEVEPSI